MPIIADVVDVIVAKINKTIISIAMKIPMFFIQK